MADELVPVKTQYPGRPPQNAPDWIHFDWIQSTAASLANDWAQLAERRLHWGALRRAGVDDPDIQYQMKKWQNLCNEILPLFDETMAILPLVEWQTFQHIRSVFGAEKSPELAVREWERLRDYCLDQLTKSPIATRSAIEAQTPAGVSYADVEKATRINRGTVKNAAGKSIAMLPDGTMDARSALEWAAKINTKGEGIEKSASRKKKAGDAKAPKRTWVCKCGDIVESAAAPDKCSKCNQLNRDGDLFDAEF